MINFLKYDLKLNKPSRNKSLRSDMILHLYPKLDYSRFIKNTKVRRNICGIQCNYFGGTSGKSIPNIEINNL